ncbi:MAG TPA: SCP2 sterol-binding domain-containing protein [Steroidobacteraceae bacterium]|jgi:ubiquinone biosynthesis protein UbiJ
MLTVGIENLLNRGLPRSPRARALCAALAGKSVAIAVRDITRLHIASTGLTLAVTRGDAPADATLSTGPVGLLALIGPDARNALQSGAVAIGGDAELAGQFQELLRLLRPDVDEEVSRVVGDVAAHRLGRLARAGAHWGRRAAATGLANAAEYLGHERADLVPRAEGEQFLRGVDALREDLDRLQARFELLAQQRGVR